jgi:hypothetical protein
LQTVFTFCGVQHVEGSPKPVCTGAPLAVKGMAEPNEQRTVMERSPDTP